MIIAELLKLTEASYRRRTELLRTKGHDYSTEDTLENFKRISAVLKALKVPMYEPWGVAMFHILHKADRVVNLVAQGRTPKNESVRDTLDDMRNYIDLLEGLLEDGKFTKEQ